MDNIGSPIEEWKWACNSRGCHILLRHNNELALDLELARNRFFGKIDMTSGEFIW